MTDCHRSGNKNWDTNWYKHWIMNKLTSGHNIWNRHWQDGQVGNKLMSHSIESVGQAVGVKSESGAGKASSETRIHMSTGRGSRSTVLDGWQVFCVRRGSTFACNQRYRRQTRDD